MSELKLYRGQSSDATVKFDAIKESFEMLSNPEKAKQMSAYMRDQFRYYGIPTPERRASYKKILLEEKKNKKVDWELLEAFINKAIGWSLRDYSKTNPEWVRNFLERYSNKLASLSIREASKYI